GTWELLDVANESEDLHGIGAQIRRELVLDRLSYLLDTAHVDILNHLHSHLLEFRKRLVFKIESYGWFFLTDFVGCCLHPLLLLVSPAAPSLVAAEPHSAVRLVLRQ